VEFGIKRSSTALPVLVNWGNENIQVFRVGGSYKF